VKLESVGKAVRPQKILDSWKKLTSGSTTRRIFGAAVTIALLTALVKVAAVAKELVVAWRFGISDDLDAFLIALLMPSFIINLVAGSFNSSFIPTYIRVRELENSTAARKLFSSVMVLGAGLLGVTTVLIIALAPLYLPLIARGFSPEKLHLTFSLLCLSAPVILLSGVVTIWGAVLNAGERFALAAFSPVITPIISIIFLLTAYSWGIYALAVGLVCGAALEMFFVGAALKRQGVPLFPRWHGADPHLRQVVKQYVPLIGGAFLMGGTYLVDQSMAAMLSPGSVAALNYGNKIVAFITGLAATALGTAVIPYFSSTVARENWLEARHILKRYLWLIFSFSIPVMILLVWVSEPLTRALFQRGAFSVEETHVVARIQSFFALQIPFYVAGILLVRLISSFRANHFLLWGAIINLVINVSLNYLLMRWLGVAGIALSTSVVYLISFTYCYVVINRLILKTESRAAGNL
jgi:putative peptidoglycan lipid II flippase